MSLCILACLCLAGCGTRNHYLVNPERNGIFSTAMTGDRKLKNDLYPGTFLINFVRNYSNGVEFYELAVSYSYVGIIMPDFTKFVLRSTNALEITADNAAPFYLPYKKTPIIEEIDYLSGSIVIDGKYYLLPPRKMVEKALFILKADQLDKIAKAKKVTVSLIGTVDINNNMIESRSWELNSQTLTDVRDFYGNYAGKKAGVEQKKDAIVETEKAIYENPLDAAAFERQGYVYAGTHDNISALDYYSMAYFLKPSDRLKNIVETLNERIDGIEGSAFYPISFDAIAYIHYNSPEYDGGNEQQTLAGMTGGGMLLANYHFNHIFAMYSGLIYMENGGSTHVGGLGSAIYHESYLDVPLAIKFKFKNPFVFMNFFPDKQAFCIGGYTGFKLSGNYINNAAFNDTLMPTVDYGLLCNYETYLNLGGVFLVSNVMVSYSLADIYPGSNEHVLSGILGFGLAF